jgi:hypothetical protein
MFENFEISLIPNLFRPSRRIDIRISNKAVRIQNKTEFEFKFNSVSCLLTPEFLVLKLPYLGTVSTGAGAGVATAGAG